MSATRHGIPRDATSSPPTLRHHDQPFGGPSCLLQVESKGTTTTVSIVGELDLAAKHDLDAAIADAFARAPDTLVVDLSKTTFIDSTGITTLVRAHRRALAQPVRLAIIPAPDRVHAVFALCGVDSVLPSHRRRSRKELAASTHGR